MYVVNIDQDPSCLLCKFSPNKNVREKLHMAYAQFTSRIYPFRSPLELAEEVPCIQTSVSLGNLVNPLGSLLVNQ